MAQFKTELFQMLQDFKDNNFGIDWEQIAHDKEWQEQLEDDLDSLIHTASFLSAIEQEKKAYILGSLVIIQAQVVRIIKSKSGLSDWSKVGVEIEQLLKELIASGSWVQEADERFDELAEKEEKFSKDEVSPAELDYFAPTLTALAIISILNSGQEDFEEDEDDE